MNFGVNSVLIGVDMRLEWRNSWSVFKVVFWDRVVWVFFFVGWFGVGSIYFGGYFVERLFIYSGCFIEFRLFSLGEIVGILIYRGDV